MAMPKKLIKMTRRWQKFAAKQRKRISFPRNGINTYSCSTSSSSVVEKGHFVSKALHYSLAYLENEIIRELLNISEEEFGLPSGGPITLLLIQAAAAYNLPAISSRFFTQCRLKKLFDSVNCWST
ncbi:hypothetical protein RND71_022257 [Anisodus tanguticus]|uniref:Uncharacterized protein n=1 Tax=Anisodus tanguticus TaxID=243964 RepID=A0AAE1RY60_9SOLA|nr:hypothetical protein RND71_022249 [Anisodus tanguticus]KAK4360028.1 hypothetical protein RND71_022257 [Anisodus tanguticus]